MIQSHAIHLFPSSSCRKRSPHPGMNLGSLRNHSKASTMKPTSTTISAYLHNKDNKIRNETKCTQLSLCSHGKQPFRQHRVRAKGYISVTHRYLVCPALTSWAPVSCTVPLSLPSPSVCWLLKWSSYGRFSSWGSQDCMEDNVIQSSNKRGLMWMTEYEVQHLNSSVS